MNRVYLKGKKGITLIALVITIIVLLILAGVAIAMLSGENGILKKAAEAKTKTEQAQKEEETNLTSMDLEMYFLTNNSKYKCKYGYITGITIEEVIEEGTKAVLRTKDTVKEFNKELPVGYSLSLKYNVSTGEDESVQESDKISNGMAITKDNEIVARIVVYGDVNCNGKILDDVLVVSKFSDYMNEGNATDFQKQAMNLNHDSYFDELDVKLALNYISNINEKIEILKMQNIYASDLKEVTNKITDKEIINNLGICEKDDFIETKDEDEKYYIINLNKSYTYKELYDLIETEESGYTVQMQSAEGKKIGKSNENTVESKTWISITIAKIVKNGALPESSVINLEVK